MPHTIRRLVLTAALLFANAWAWGAAPDTPIATLNARKILQESKVAKEALARFQLEFLPREKALQGLAQALKEKTADFEKLGPSLAPAQVTEKQGELDALARELKRRQQQFGEDRDARKRDDIEHVFAVATQAVKQVANGTHMDIVFQDVVYANPRTDITDAVIAVMDAQPAN